MEKTVELRRKNQLTWPFAKEMHLDEGVRLVIEYDPGTDEARVRPLRLSYAGALRGVYGADRAIDEYITGERESWD